MSVLPTLVQLQLDGVWTDITDKVYARDDVQIFRGRSDEGAQVDPSTLTLTLDNRDGRFSPRNPLSPYFGVLGRNTPIRFGLETADVWLAVPGTAGSGVTTTDKATLDIVGDIDIRVEADLPSWRGTFDVAGKWVDGSQQSWIFFVDEGRPALGWTTGGTDATYNEVIADAVLPSSGPLAVRATLDVDNGASGHTLTVYTSDSISGSWTQLGDAVVVAGTTSIFSSTAPLEVGDATGTMPPEFTVLPGIYGRVYAFELRSSIGGTVVANPVFTSQTSGATSFADTAGTPNTWTVAAGSELTNMNWRIHPEVASWPQRWDITEIDAYVPIQAAGILRRLGQGASPLGSTMRRVLTSQGQANPPVAYWPCEDGANATQIASGLPGGFPMDVRIAQPSYAAYTEFDCSSPLPTVQNSSWHGVVPAYVPGVDGQVRFLFHIDTGANGQRVITAYTSGSIASIRVYYGTGGTLDVRAYDNSETLLASTGGAAFAIDGRITRMSLEMTQNGGNVDFGLVVINTDGSNGASAGATAAGETFGRITAVGTNAGGLTTGDNRATFGHISVHAAKTSIFDIADETAAFDGETAGRRFERLCGEEAIEFRGIGGMDDTEQMGPQLSATLVELLRQCAEVDGGIMFEPKEVLALGYRARTSVYGQVTRVAIDHDANELSAPLEPVGDDQLTRNSVTVTRTSGSSAVAEEDEGPLSVLPPPLGVGRYDSSVSVNAYADDRLSDLAYWRVALGTVDEPRYPAIDVNRQHRPILANPTLDHQLLTFELGDRLTIDNPPAGMPPDQVTQIIQGCRETITRFKHGLQLIGSPALPWDVAFADALLGKVNSGESTLAEDLDTTETAVDVAIPAGGLLWTTDAGEFPFDVEVGGEVMTVTAISGASSPQTFTVVRSVNGITKTHLTGASIDIAVLATTAL